MIVYTLGHSTRSLDELIDTLKNFRIELVVDVRRFPTSKKFPWFSKDKLQEGLNKDSIQYIHLPQLGGCRKEGYENFTKTEEFKEAIEKLLKIIDGKTAVILCSEILWFRCHRRYVAKALVERGYTVTHIFNKEKIQEHKVESKDVEEKMKLKIFCDKG